MKKVIVFCGFGFIFRRDKEKLSNGKMKPPLLNGMAHTWHHELELLKKIINIGRYL